MNRLCLGVIVGLAFIGIGYPALSDESRLDAVMERGFVVCGVSKSGIGLSEVSASGRWEGFFVDYCRVLGAAIFGDSEAVEYVEVTDVNRFDALNQGAIDVLMANTTWTATRDTKLNLAFAATLLYDGQGFLVHRSLGAPDMDSVTNASVCVNENTTTIQNLGDLIASRKPGLEVMGFNTQQSLYEAFLTRRCDMLTYDRIVLRALQLHRVSDPQELVLFPDIISKEPLGPAVVQGDPRWMDVVQWSVFATIAAEELGITSANVDGAESMDLSEEARRLLGLSGEIGAGLGLDADWARRIVKNVGNYGEIYAKHLGDSGRGLNELWMHGGLLYAPPFR